MAAHELDKNVRFAGEQSDAAVADELGARTRDLFRRPSLHRPRGRLPQSQLENRSDCGRTGRIREENIRLLNVVISARTDRAQLGVDEAQSELAADAGLVRGGAAGRAADREGDAGPTAAGSCGAEVSFLPIFLVKFVIREETKSAFNVQFGSVFRTHHAPTLFSRRLFRYADVYTSSVTNLCGYSLEHRFFPRRGALPHEFKFLFL